MNKKSTSFNDTEASRTLLLATYFVTTAALSCSSWCLFVSPGKAWAAESACEQIQQACGEAGFTRDNPSGRDLDTKCFKPIMNGEGAKVSGVHVDPSLVKKCKTESQPKKSGGQKTKSHPLAS